MTIAPIPILFSPTDLLSLEEDGLYELVDGRLVEKKLGSLANRTAGIVLSRLLTHIEKTEGGAMYPEQSFQCFPHDPKMVRRPDVAFIAARRLPSIPDEGHIPIPPDLAIEVVSPNDLIYELDRKIEDYFHAGVKLVWVINPDRRYLRVYRDNRVSASLHENETVSGEDVLPGFSIKVGDLLPPKEKGTTRD